MTIQIPDTTDPTENVRALVVAEARRLDDLRQAETRRVDERFAGMCSEARMRAEFAAQLFQAEAARLDAIRAVDVAAVGTANERAGTQAEVLASQVAQTAETLRGLVATQGAVTSERIRLLEQANYEGRGKGLGADYLWRAAVVLGGAVLAYMAFARGGLPG